MTGILPDEQAVVAAVTYDIEHLPADFIGYIKRVQEHAGYENHAFRLARALQMRVRVSPYNYAIPESQPQPVIFVDQWNYGSNSPVLHHEIAHVMLYWSGLESHVLGEYGYEDGWKVVERLCNQAVAFLQIPQPMVDDAVRRCGVSAKAVLHLQKLSGADVATALRRLIYDQPDAERAGFLTNGNYIGEVAMCNFGLPFGWLDRVPEPIKEFPKDAAVSFAKVRGGNLLGVAYGFW